MNATAIDWEALARLRGAFLEGTAGAQDYWRQESDLASYDATFAQRIGWKWDYVLAELAQRGWTPPAGDWLDWGCGSGIAHRTVLDHFQPRPFPVVWLHDRSPVAAAFAERRARQRFPSLEPRMGIPEAPALLLLSHVLTELHDDALAELLVLVRRATAVLWVEPGTHATSRRLIGVREQLLGEYNVIAPCPHAGACGMLAAGNASHWCHHFAPPPAAVFTDPDWGRFAHLAGIDLRSLPLSFLALDRRPAPALPANTIRVIGRPRVYKAFARVLACGAGGVRDVELGRRELPEEFRRLKKDTFAPLQVWEERDGKVVAARPL